MGFFAKCPISILGHSNGRARHATTLKHPRCSDPGSRSDHAGERTGFQSSLEFALPHARSERCPTRPNTCAVANAFAGAGHQRTEHAARRDGATRPAAAPGRPSDATRAAFCFPIPDRSLARAEHGALPCTKVRRRRPQGGRAVHGQATLRMRPVMPPTFAVSCSC